MKPTTAVGVAMLATGVALGTWPPAKRIVRRYGDAKVGAVVLLAGVLAYYAAQGYELKPQPLPP